MESHQIQVWVRVQQQDGLDLSPGLWRRVGLPLETLRVSVLTVITITVIHFIVAGWICWRAAGARPGEGRLHGSVTCRGEDGQHASYHLLLIISSWILLHIIAYYWISKVKLGFYRSKNLQFGCSQPDWTNQCPVSTMSTTSITTAGSTTSRR